MARSWGKTIKKIAVTGAAVAYMVLAASCGASEPARTESKDVSSEGYPWSFFQHARGTEHNRELVLFVDRLNPWPGSSNNVLEGTYYNTGTEAPEHLRDPAGRMVFTQIEQRRYFDFWDNARNDVSRIMLFNPNTQELNTAFMTRYKTEWWGDADLRAVSVNNGPIMFRVEGVTNHLGITTQQVFSVAIPKRWENYSWMFNQDRAADARGALDDLLRNLENTDFKPPTHDILMSTRDGDRFLDWAGVETAPAQGELFNGKVPYVIAASYLGPHNQLFAGRGWWMFRQGLYGHPGAPDRGNKAGSSLDTVLIAEGYADNPSEWRPRAKIIVNHPSWSNQTEYQFVRVNADGREEEMGTLQRTYNNKTVSKTTSGGDNVVVDLAATNNYLAKGDLEFMQQCLVLLGGQQIPLGFDYKTSFMDYGLALISIGEGLSAGDIDPELAASLNVNADATLNRVIDAAKGVLGRDAPPEFEALRREQNAANDAYQKDATQNPHLLTAYGLK